jgi:hypothetical protein
MELATSGGEELAIGRDVHHRLGDREHDDLRIRHASTRVLCPLGQEIVGRGEHSREQQVEVGEHRGPLVDSATRHCRLRPPLASCASQPQNRLRTAASEVRSSAGQSDLADPDPVNPPGPATDR